MISITGDRVAIIPIHDSDTTSGQHGDPNLPAVKLWIPDEAKRRSSQGLVKYVGPSCKYIRPGMYVIYSQYSGTLTEIEDEGKLIIMNEEFIVAELHEEHITIPGLFFNSATAPRVNVSLLKNKIKEAIDLPEEMLTHVAQHLYLSGFIHPETAFFNATYEKVMELAAREFTKQNLTKDIETPRLRDEEWETGKV